ncbi:7-cyano-7-deazaguanine synthase QueC [Cerasicoccus arenae]|uniref:7-cyano-7-deazaguanine synthase n=1 Tax=Cerasicoccus arenae TaxID=424488 RepID=A0A8J3DIA4_9BACT|nr:7-cyano-7-deazaguanine synthase QueC [Cerasicoccus arenae]MBK1858945.1 7-cyano-7-deazaguanine synthase QueC [Cerasicoccus arenae]GHC04011.1 7-cyano-7-deazaguanine synthase [Cerasicoccus arenae]
MNAVLIYSGGLDSTVLLHHLHQAGNELAALSVNYGQRHSREIECARQQCARLGIEHRVADLRSLAPLLGANSLTDSAVDVPQGHYTEETMKATVVPNRNMIMLSVATGWAISRKSDCVAYAAHSGDHAIYPDCRREFAEALDAAIRLADWHEVHLYRPFVDWTKADIAKRGEELGVPFAETWSCYQGGEVHCGQCGTCIERREAFYLAEVDDPTPYAMEAPTVDQLVAQFWRLS